MKKFYTNNSSSFNGQKMGVLWESDGTLMGGLSIEHRSNMNGRRMGEMRFAEFAKVYFARVAAVLLLLMTLSVGQVWGAIDLKNGAYVYMDDSNSSWDYSYVYLSRGDYDSNGSYLWRMNKVTNTNLYITVPNAEYNNCGFICLFGATSSWGTSGGTYDNMKQYGANITNCVPANTSFSSGKGHLITPSGKGSTSTPSAITVATSKWASYNDLNTTQKLSARVSVDGGAYSAPSINPATLTVTGMAFSDWKTCNSPENVSKTGGAGYESPQASIGYTATTTMTISNVQTDYSFEGFYDAQTGGNLLCSETTYAYTTRDAKTVYARFAYTTPVTMYTVAYATGNTGGTSVSCEKTSDHSNVAYNATVESGTEVKFTAVASTGNEVEGWYNNADLADGHRLQAGGNTYTTTVTSNTAVWVKFQSTGCTPTEWYLKCANRTETLTLVSGSDFKIENLAFDNDWLYFWIEDNCGTGTHYGPATNNLDPVGMGDIVLSSNSNSFCISDHSYQPLNVYWNADTKTFSFSNTPKTPSVSAVLVKNTILPSEHVQMTITASNADGYTYRIHKCTNSDGTGDAGYYGDVTNGDNYSAANSPFNFESVHTFSVGTHYWKVELWKDGMVKYESAVMTLVVADLAPASEYYVYLGQTLTLDVGPTYTKGTAAPAQYASSLDPLTTDTYTDGNVLSGNTYQCNTLGRFEINGGASPIVVYVYRYYAKHPWGSCQTEANETYRKSWVWRGMDYTDHAVLFTGTYGKVLGTGHSYGADLAWDYAYDWDGVYQLDGSESGSYRPGSKWMDETDVSSGASLWKNAELSGTCSEDLIDHTYAGVDPVSTSAPTLTEGNYSFTVNTTITKYTLTFASVTNGSQSEVGGKVSSTLGSTSPVKVADGTEVEVNAVANTGYTFAGWYSEPECTNKLTEATAYAITIDADKAVYAKFEQSCPSGIKVCGMGNWDSGNRRTMAKDPSDCVFTYTYNNLNAGNYEFCLWDGGDNWYKANTVGLDYALSTHPLGDSGEPNHNFTISLPVKGSLTITLTYNSASDIVVDAVFTPAKVYVVGRFKVQDGAGNYTFTGASDGNWADNSTNIEMLYNSISGVYELNTHCTVGELSAEISSTRYYFHLTYGGDNIGSKSQNAEPSLNEAPAAANTENDSKNFLFNRAGKPWSDVTLHWNPTENKLWYTVTVPTRSVGVAYVNCTAGPIQDQVNYDVAEEFSSQITAPEQITYNEVTYTFATWAIGEGVTKVGGELTDRTISVTATQGMLGGLAAHYIVPFDLPATTTYYVYAGHDLNLPGNTETENYTYSGSSHVTSAGLYHSDEPRVSHFTQRAESKCSGIIYKEQAITVNCYKHYIKYPNNGEGWKYYGLTDNGDGTYYRKIQYGGSGVNIISETSVIPDGTEDHSVAKSRYYHASGGEDDCRNVHKEASFNNGDDVYVIFNELSTIDDYKTKGGRVDYKIVDKVTLTYAPVPTFINMALVSTGASVNVVGIVSPTTTLQYSIDGETWNTWTSYTPTVAGTYYFRAEVTGTNAIGQVGPFYSNVVEVAVTAPSMTLEYSPVSIYPNTTITFTPNITGVPVGLANVIACYEYTRNTTGANETFTQDGNNAQNTPGVIGDYTVQVTLKYGANCGEAVPLCQATADFTVLDNYVTLDVPATASVGNVNMTATSNLVDATYTFYVKLPGEVSFTQFATGASSATHYNCPMVGSYTFKVEATKGDVTEEDTKTCVISASTLYLRYSFYDDCHDTRGRNNVPMTYNATDGTYYYYQEHADHSGWFRPVSSYDASWDVTYGSNKHDGQYGWVGSTNVGYDPSEGWLTIENPENLQNSTNPVIFHYDQTQNKLWITGATTSYRVKSDGTNGTFYSNVVKGAEKEISFYASTDATLTWETSTNGLDGWEHHSNFNSGTPISSNGIYVCTPTAIDASAQSVSEYAGVINVYSVAFGTNALTKFTTTTYYDHYFVEWADAGKNVGATMGNSINTNISTVLSQYSVPVGTNVRYEYKAETNRFTRTLIGGSSGDEFINIYGDNIKKTDATVINTEANSLKLTDGSNWVYTADIKAEMGGSDAKVTLVSTYNSQKSWILAADGSQATAEANKVVIVGNSTTNGTYNLRLIYDYKTNKITAGWLGGNVEDDKVIDADMLVIREDTDTDESGITIVNMTNNSTVISINSIITLFEMHRDHFYSGNNDAHTWISDNNKFYWFSLPYDCKISDIYGWEGYGTKWWIEEYRGDARAAISWFDFIPTWWSMMYTTGTMKANVGYVICVIPEWNDFKTVNETSKLTLYFPSAKKEYTISENDGKAIDVDEHKCNVQSPQDRRLLDSDWNVIGIPGYMTAKVESATGYTTKDGVNAGDGFKYYYHWNRIGNYTPEAVTAGTTTFNPTFAYMVQYAGTITWSTKADLAWSAPRRQSSATGRFCLQLRDMNEQMLDQTFVTLSEDGREAYDLGDDLMKIFTNGTSQIYTSADNISLAANDLSDTTTIVTIGTQLADNDAYVFHLSETVAGQTPYLYDAELETYTNLTTSDYTFTADMARSTGRFYLVFGYQAPQTPTGVDSGTVDSDGGGGPQKFIRNGVLYILNNGKLYNANGSAL